LASFMIVRHQLRRGVPLKPRPKSVKEPYRYESEATVKFITR
jgi:hypothetical protein